MERKRLKEIIEQVRQSFQDYVPTFVDGVEMTCDEILKQLEDKMKCNFDWVEFHAKLDIAVAHMIEEKSKYPDTCLPSKTTIMELMNYSYEKVKKGGCFQKK